MYSLPMPQCLAIVNCLRERREENENVVKNDIKISIWKFSDKKLKNTYIGLHIVALRN